MTCRHCGRPKVNRTRSLCWKCWHTPGVRGLYPSASKYARRGEPDFDGRAAAAEPTAAWAGSEAKVAVMAARAAKRQALFHPADSRRLAEPDRPCGRHLHKNGKGV